MLYDFLGQRSRAPAVPHPIRARAGPTVPITPPSHLSPSPSFQSTCRDWSFILSTTLSAKMLPHSCSVMSLHCLTFPSASEYCQGAEPPGGLGSAGPSPCLYRPASGLRGFMAWRAGLMGGVAEHAPRRRLRGSRSVVSNQFTLHLPRGSARSSASSSAPARPG